MTANLLPNGLPLTNYILSNGLHLYVVENHSAPVFSYQTWVKTGSRDERLDPDIQATGLAHLFEHLMFRGTAAHPDGEFDTLLFEAGANDQNATTWNDRTCYYESLPSTQLDLIASLEADRLVNLDVTQHFETERQAVLGELAMVQDEPVSVAQDLLYETAFTVHPYRYPVIGSKIEIENFKAEDAVSFYRKYYSPGNVSIFVVGDVNPGKVYKTIQKYYSAIPWTIVPTVVAPCEPKQTAERKAEFRHSQLTEAKLVLGYHTPAITHPDFPALSVLNSVLALGEGSLLHQAWIEAGKGSGLQGDLDAFKDPGLLIFALDLQPGVNVSDALLILDQVIAKIISGSPQDLERAKNQLLLSIYSQWDDNAAFGSYLGESLCASGDPLGAFRFADLIETVTALDLVRVTNGYLQASQRTVVVGHPK